MTQHHGTAPGSLITINTIFIQALTTDLFFLSPYLKGSKHGRDTNGEWMWDEIKECREDILELEKGREAKSPRLYRSSDRSEYTNEE